ncbi:hypothetical protein [Streptomyces sp. NPDC002265]|uniref:hypothetical protein n=1 Tax=Streptomyces sp. NPDC002265 TaxID=3154415 RepID=UPI00331B2065
MTKKPRGTGEHGWASDVDETRQQDNPSAHRSFRTVEYGGGKGPGRTKSEEETRPVPGDTVKSDSTRGEEHARGGQKGHRSTGARGRSQRPSGTKDASAETGIDPQESRSGHRQG